MKTDPFWKSVNFPGVHNVGNSVSIIKASSPITSFKKESREFSTIQQLQVGFSASDRPIWVNLELIRWFCFNNGKSFSPFRTHWANSLKIECGPQNPAIGQFKIYDSCLFILYIIPNFMSYFCHNSIDAFKNKMIIR